MRDSIAENMRNTNTRRRDQWDYLERREQQARSALARSRRMVAILAALCAALVCALAFSAAANDGAVAGCIYAPADYQYQGKPLPKTLRPTTEKRNAIK